MLSIVILSPPDPPEAITALPAVGGAAAATACAAASLDGSCCLNSLIAWFQVVILI